MSMLKIKQWESYLKLECDRTVKSEFTQDP